LLVELASDKGGIYTADMMFRLTKPGEDRLTKPGEEKG
jgi:hypothetical protein